MKYLIGVRSEVCFELPRVIPVAGFGKADHLRKEWLEEKQQELWRNFRIAKVGKTLLELAKGVVAIR